MRETDAVGTCVCVRTCICGHAEYVCVCVCERRIEAGIVRGPSGGEMRIRASSKSGEFVEDASAI